MVRHDSDIWELLIWGHFRAPPFPLMTSWRPDDVIVEIFKIAQKWSKLTGYCLNRPCKSSCQVSDRHGQRLGSNRLFSWAFCRVSWKVERMRTEWKGPWERCFKVDLLLEMVRHDSNIRQLLIRGHFSAPPFPLMTSRSQNDVIVEILKIAQKWSESIGYGLEQPCKSFCQVSDRHGPRFGSNRPFSWAFCRVSWKVERMRTEWKGQWERGFKVDL